MNTGYWAVEYYLDGEWYEYECHDTRKEAEEAKAYLSGPGHKLRVRKASIWTKGFNRG